MPRADPKRIAWFLNLQRVLRFPKYFMAPLAIFRPRRSLLASDAEITETGVPSSRRESTSPTRSRRLSAPPLPMLNQAISPTDNPGLTNALRIARDAMSISTSGFSPRQKIPISAYFQKPAHRSERLVERPVLARHEFAIPTMSRQPDIDPDALAIRPEKSVPLAPIPTFSSGQRFADSERFPEPTATARGTNEVAFGRGLAASNEYPPIDNASENRYDSPSSDQGGTREGAQPQHNRPAVSTLHIDGSALGRWAVQHLERALGKPATGMTGVDPRATIPRSRVAPF